MLLKDKVALVTGASQGIGKVTSLALAKQGADIVVNYIIDHDGANALVEEIKKLGRDAIAIEADVTKADQLESMAEKVKEKFGKVSILVNNAGITKDRTVKKMTQEEWQTVIDINLTGTFNSTKAVLPLIEEGGSIVSISSIVGICGNFGQANYSATKAGVIAFTKTLAKELGKKNIRVNAVAPGFIVSPMTEKLPFVRKKFIESVIPLKEFGHAENVADAVVFLSSDMASYVTSHVLRVDGGLNF